MPNINWGFQLALLYIVICLYISACIFTWSIVDPMYIAYPFLWEIIIAVGMMVMNKIEGRYINYLKEKGGDDL